MVMVFFCKKIICEKCLSRLSGVGQSLTDNAFMNQAVIDPSYCHRPQSSVVKTGNQDSQPFRGYIFLQQIAPSTPPFYVMKKTLWELTVLCWLGYDRTNASNGP